MKLQGLVVAAVLALAALATQAQTLTKPAEFYFDEDRNTARLIVAVQGEGEPLAEQLVKQIERGRNRVEATAQLAHVAIGQNRLELGEKLYQEALESTEGRGTLGRAVRWNYGWDLYRQDQKQDALVQWAELAKGFGSPSWVPPTLALVLWDLDRKAEATQWYAAAVRTEPLLWGNPANFPTLLPGWSDAEHKRLAEVFTAWQADPPTWP
jgi:Tfp pilus assembly protein PilF